VFGTLFRAGGKALEGRDRLDADGFALFLESGLEAVMTRGGCKVGQKTMVDALAPAAAAAAASRTASLSDAVAAATTAAREGAEATRGMVATTGKARSLGERSLGHVDPGAISVTLILGAMNDHLSGR
jgi:dihydroxyacetone kinase-like protein